MNASWGVNRALSALYGDVGKRENANRELGVLSAMEQMRQYDEQQENLARQENDARRQRVHEFSNKLLGPDREAFNQKAMLLQQKMKEQLRQYGGSVKKFMDNGGHQLMASYENDLLNSDEASQFMSNKRNMDLLVAAQMAGKGHLISKRDMINMQNYEKNGGGEITYSGLMNDIEMPDPEHYNWDEPIPAEDILKHPGNYVKIYGNWRQTFPDLGEPTERDLIEFTRDQYKGKGANWRRQAYYDEQRQKRAAAAAKTKTEEKKNAYKHQYSGMVSTIFQNAGQNLRIEDYQPGYWENKYVNPRQVDVHAPRKYKGYAQDYALKENTFLDYNRQGLMGSGVGMMPNWIEDWFSQEYQPREARYYYEGDEAVIARAGLNLGEKDIDTSKNVIRNWEPNDNSFTAAGVRLGDLDQKIDKDAYGGNYKIEGIINGAYGTVSNGPHQEAQQMVMNVLDESGDFDSEKSAEFDKFLEGADLRHDLFVVLTDDNGNTFYQPLNFDSNRTQGKLMKQLEEYDNYTPAIMNSEYIREQEDLTDKAVQEAMGPINSYYDQFDQRTDFGDYLVSELLKYSRTGQYDNSREDLAKSFYAAFAQLQGGNVEESLGLTEVLMNGSAFTQFIDDLGAEMERDLAYDISGSNIGDKEFILNAMDKDRDNEALYQLWLQNYKALGNR